MDIYVYLYVRGDKFSPKAFQSQLSEPSRGSVHFHKRVRKGVAERVQEYWMSQEIEASDHFEAMTKLHDLVSQLHPNLLTIHDNEVVISAKLVSFCRSEQAFHGFYVPPETIRLFAEVGASLDIDQYYRVDD